MNEAQRDILSIITKVGKFRVSRDLKDANALVEKGLAQWAGFGKHFDYLVSRKS